MGASSFSTEGVTWGSVIDDGGSGVSGLVHRIAMRREQVVRVSTRGIDTSRMLFVGLLLVGLFRQRRRGEGGEANAGRSVHESKTEGTFYPVFLGGAAASIISLEMRVLLHEVVGNGVTIVKMTLQQVHRRVVDR